MNESTIVYVFHNLFNKQQLISYYLSKIKILNKTLSECYLFSLKFVFSFSTSFFCFSFLTSFWTDIKIHQLAPLKHISDISKEILLLKEYQHFNDFTYLIIFLPISGRVLDWCCMKMDPKMQFFFSKEIDYPYY